VWPAPVRQHPVSGRLAMIMKRAYVDLEDGSLSAIFPGVAQKGMPERMIND